MKNQIQNSNRNQLNSIKTATQSGFALIVFITIMLVGTAAILISSVSTNSGQRQSQTNSANILFAAKRALIGWSLSHPNYPGLLPYPDTNADGNYDGNSDCPSVTVTNTHLIGRIPWRSQDSPCPSPLTGIGTQYRDNTGQTIWYAVSRNLVHHANTNTYPTINSELRNLNSNWITVVDNRGNIISDRVAFVLFSPGNAVANQSRDGAAAAVNQFLDSVTISGTTYSNADNDHSFVISPHTDTFNDILLYVTIDELVTVIENKVLRDVKSCLDNYASANSGYYPSAVAISGSSTNSNNGKGKNKDKGNDKGKAKGKKCDKTNNGKGKGGQKKKKCEETTSSSSDFGRFDTSISWPSNCVINKPVWNTWSDSVFYQVSPNFIASGTKSCPSCISINGTGAYHAIVILAGQRLSGQSRTTTSDKETITNYLEDANTSLDDYQYDSKAESTSFNDRLICVDGNNVCR